MPAREAPQPPYVLLFEEARPGAAPLVVSVDERAALPLFDSAATGRAFLGCADFGRDWRPVEVSGAGLLAAMKKCRGQAGYVALTPPPAKAGGGMRVEMGGLEELIDAFEQSQRENDLFGLGGSSRN